ncbi:agmatinase [bacterium]|nr:agmatinase [bacterium]
MIMFYTHYVTFGDFPEEYKDIEKARAIIVPVPLEETSTYLSGTRFAPDEVILASRALEWFDESLEFEPFRKGIATIASPLWERGNVTSCLSQLEETVEEIIRQGKFPIVIGGEHTITFADVRGVLKHYSDLSCLIFDAHADLRSSYDRSSFSHACVTRRISELDIESIVEVGIRSLSLEENDYINSTDKVRVIKARDFLRDPKFFIENISSMLSDNVFISIDMDVFDPSLVPAVGTPEPGGLLWYNVIDILEEVFAHKNVVGCDVVELLWMDKTSCFITARLIYKLIAYKFFYE